MQLLEGMIKPSGKGQNQFFGVRANGSGRPFRHEIHLWVHSFANSAHQLDFIASRLNFGTFCSLLPSELTMDKVPLFDQLAIPVLKRKLYKPVYTYTYTDDD